MSIDIFLWLDIIFSIGIIFIISYFVYRTVMSQEGWYRAAIIGLWLWLARPAFFVQLPHYLGWDGIADFFNSYWVKAAIFFLGAGCLLVGVTVDTLEKTWKKREAQLIKRIRKHSQEDVTDE